MKKNIEYKVEYIKGKTFDEIVGLARRKQEEDNKVAENGSD